MNNENRQNLSDYDANELSLREADTKRLVHDLIGKHEEYFDEPQHRLDFVAGQTATNFLEIARHINARLRGEKPHVMRQQGHEMGGFLPILHTPSHEDKPLAFDNGYRAIQEYIASTSDTTDKKIEGVAMATEALIIWTHIFNDGNGRTARFLATLIEDGASDVDKLISHTSSNANRGRRYTRNRLYTREAALEDANNTELMLDDSERNELREEALSFPSDVDAMYLNIKRLLEYDAIRQDTHPQRLLSQKVA